MAALILCGPHRVRHLFVEGRQVVRDGVLTTLDGAELTRQSAEATARLAG